MFQQEQQQQQQPVTPSSKSFRNVQHFYALPSLPTKLWLPQCISFGNELLICGGYNNNHCYSYHVKKQQYKLICSYPNNITLLGHTVIPCFIDQHNDPLSNNTTKSTLTLLSFGGDGVFVPHHTMFMHYQSLWSEHNSHNSHYSHNNSSNNHNNRWISLPDHKIFGKAHGYDLAGARALIGGSQNHLLFITHYPNIIDIVDLKTFRYVEGVRHQTLPVSENNKVWYHCFVKLTFNQFILISRYDSILIKYNESRREFFYEILPICPSLRNCYDYAYVNWDGFIFIFGGYDVKNLDSISKYNIKEKKWSECHYKMPFPIHSSVAVVNETDSSVHIIGGANDNGKSQSTHYVNNMKELVGWTPKEIAFVLECWIRQIELKQIGWIKEFNDIVGNYLGQRNSYRNKKNAILDWLAF